MCVIVHVDFIRACDTVSWEVRDWEMVQTGWPFGVIFVLNCVLGFAATLCCYASSQMKFHVTLSKEALSKCLGWRSILGVYMVDVGDEYMDNASDIFSCVYIPVSFKS